MGDIRAILILVLVLCFTVVSIPQIGVTNAEPKTIVVPDDYPVIQEAVDNTVEEDIVFVKSGLYFQTVIINKSINLIGENRETTILDGNGTTTIYIETDNVTITGFTIQNASVSTQEGILLLYANNCNISGNRLVNNTYGIDLISSDYNIVSGNIFEENSAGLSVSGFNNNISRNEINNCNTGIQISYGANNTISENNLENNSANGINLYDTQSNKIIRNNIIDSGERGLLFTASHNNSFSWNNFSNNVQTFDSHYVLDWIDISVNIWDNGSKGNYWNNYNGTDNDGDGIGDSAHFVYEDNQDNYPLMEPVDISTIPEFPSWIILPFFIVATLVVIVIRNKIRKKGLE
ncbi:nitrous oxide reductase family maturation protein NosD [Thermoproteota archaeon]